MAAGTDQRRRTIHRASAHARVRGSGLTPDWLDWNATRVFLSGQLAAPGPGLTPPGKER